MRLSWEGKTELVERSQAEKLSESQGMALPTAVPQGSLHGWRVLQGSLGTPSPSSAPSHGSQGSCHHANPCRGCISRECQAESVTRLGPASCWGCCNSEEPHLPLPLTARSLQHFAIHKQRQLQRESEGGRSPGRGGSCPARAHWLLPLCPTPGLWQAQATFKPCPLLTAGPMTLLTRCCFERTFASFSCYILPR